jgi:hypothetical protein
VEKVGFNSGYHVAAGITEMGSYEPHLVINLRVPIYMFFLPIHVHFVLSDRITNLHVSYDLSAAVIKFPKNATSWNNSVSNLELYPSFCSKNTGQYSIHKN